LSRLPTTVLQADSTGPEPICQPPAQVSRVVHLVLVVAEVLHLPAVFFFQFGRGLA